MKIRRIDFSPDEWIAGTVGLGNAERGLYITACALIYSRGGAVSVDHLRATCRDHGHSFKHQLKQLLELGKLSLNEGQITSKRCSNELQNASKRLSNASQNGTRGNEIKKLRADTRSQERNANHQLSEKEERKGSEFKTDSELLPSTLTPLSTDTAPPSAPRYAFEGEVIRLLPKDFNRWAKAFHAIPDLAAKLCALDAHYDETLIGKDRGHWFVRCSNALRNDHNKLLEAQRQQEAEDARDFDPCSPPTVLDHLGIVIPPLPPNCPIFKPLSQRIAEMDAAE